MYDKHKYLSCVDVQGIMKDRWMNVGFEDEELKPYREPSPDLNDQARIREYIILIVHTHVHTVRLSGNLTNTHV